MDVSTVTEKISVIKASYNNVQKSNKDSEINFEFSDEIGNLIPYKLNELPNGEVILAHFEDSNRLVLKITIDGNLKSQKVLFDNTRTQNNKTEYMREVQTPQLDQQTGNFLQGIVKTYSDGQKEFLLSMKDQFNAAFQSLQAQQKDAFSNIKEQQDKTISDMRNQQKEFMDFMKNLERDSSERIKRDSDARIEAIKTQNELDNKFLQTKMENQIEHLKQMQTLELEKEKLNHKIEIDRNNLTTDKTTAKEWADILKETTPTLVSAVRDSYNLYKEFKDIDIKVVN